MDTEWLKTSTGLLKKLRHLKWLYSEGQTRQGRADMGIINATGCSSVWGSTYPYNPYPFPWTNHLFQDSPSIALGVFQGHMTKMAEGFKAIRQAELELAGEYRAQEHDEFFTYFTWKVSARKSGCCARRWFRLVAMALCTTSVSRTCRAY